MVRLARSARRRPYVMVACVALALACALTSCSPRQGGVSAITRTPDDKIVGLVMVCDGTADVAILIDDAEYSSASRDLAGKVPDDQKTAARRAMSDSWVARWEGPGVKKGLLRVRFDGSAASDGWERHDEPSTFEYGRTYRFGASDHNHGWSYGRVEFDRARLDRLAVGQVLVPGGQVRTSLGAWKRHACDGIGDG